MPSYEKRVPHRLVIAKWHDFLSNDLTGFVTFAGNQQHVASCEILDRTVDRLIAVADLVGAGRAAQNRSPDGARLFAARIVVRDDDTVRFFGRNCPHQGPLADVTVATGA